VWPCSRHAFLAATSAFVVLIGVAPASAAMTSTTAATRSITVQLATGNTGQLAALARTRRLSPQTRLRRLRSLLPNESTRSQTEAILARWGFRVSHETAFTVSAVAPADRVRAAFRRRSTQHGATGTLDTGVLAGLASSVVDDTTLVGKLRPALTPTQITGLDAQQLYDTTDGTPEAGMTSPTIATLQFSGWDDSDLSAFASGNGQPDPVATGQYTPVSVDGADPGEPDGTGGEIEVALDQESLLAAAPNAPQRAYFTNNSAQGEIDALEQIASDAVTTQHIGALSISWGMCEAMADPALGPVHQALTDVLAAGVTVFAASGDSGAFDCNEPGAPDSSLAVDYPASDPLVVGVGGTTVDDTVATTPQEQVWWDPATQNGGGGGVSSEFDEPDYQTSTTALSGRGVPDIALDADPASGVDVYVDGSTGTVGGTSLASPLAAATFTDMLASHGVTGGVGDIHFGLYGAPANAFRDITVGDNGFYAAGPGYDEASGLGAPQWQALAPGLIGFITVHAPAYSRSRTIPVSVAGFPGATYTGWEAGVGTEPTDCDPAAMSPTQPTSVHAPADGRVTVWVVGYIDGSCFLDDGTTTVDTLAPSAHASAAAAHPNSAALSFRWSATDGSPSSGIAHYAVTVTHSGSSTPDYRNGATRSTAVTLAGVPGRTYTLTVTATDNAGNTSTVRKATVTLPFDDRSLHYSTHWAHTSSTSAYLHTLDSTATRGASAQLTAVGRSFTALVTTCSTCGSLTEYIDGHRIRTVSLRTSTRHYIASFTVARFSSSGRHTVKLVDAAGHIDLDGIAVAP